MTHTALQFGENGAYLVRAPRWSDPLGQPLRRLFTPAQTNSELDRLLALLDRRGRT